MANEEEVGRRAEQTCGKALVKKGPSTEQKRVKTRSGADVLRDGREEKALLNERTCRRSTRCMRGTRNASGQAEGRREKGSRDSLFFSFFFYLFYVQVRV